MSEFKHVSFKKYLLITTVLSVFFLLPFTASAETVAQGTCGANLTWVLDDAGTLTISGEGEMEDYSYGGSRQPWYSYQSSVNKIILNPGVTSIGSYAFSILQDLKIL